ncbi:hypothetical protein [Frigoriflavimonas asaccharolytica]|nr:hypothetical protein [Frigoriflavimonas asaccharolytica]
MCRNFRRGKPNAVKPVGSSDGGKPKLNEGFGVSDDQQQYKKS